MGKAAQRKKSDDRAREQEMRKVRRDTREPSVLYEGPLLKLPASGWTEDWEKRSSRVSLAMLVVGCITPAIGHFGLGPGVASKAAAAVGIAIGLLGVWEHFAGTLRKQSVRRV